MYPFLPIGSLIFYSWNYNNIVPSADFGIVENSTQRFFEVKRPWIHFCTVLKDQEATKEIKLLTTQEEVKKYLELVTRQDTRNTFMDWCFPISKHLTSPHFIIREFSKKGLK